MRDGASRALYVEVFIRAGIDSVWHLTQDPVQHPRWDLRFSRIVRAGMLPEGGYRFEYERRLPGHTIRGTGTTIGEVARPDGTRTSALRFATGCRLSPLRSGRGYWRYVPVDGGIRFITGYDYRPGFGRLIDRLVRPGIVWMTAWSFDRLRIWAESDTAPERWPLRSVLAFWRPERPRASRCVTVPPGRDTMRDAPATLDELAQP